MGCNYILIFYILIHDLIIMSSSKAAFVLHWFLYLR